MPYKLVVDLITEGEGPRGVVFPVPFTYQLPRTCTRLRVVDYLKKKFAVNINYLGNNVWEVQDATWLAFVDAFIERGIHKVCFTWKKIDKLHVAAFNKEGVEIRKRLNGHEFVHSCIVQADETSYYTQLLPHRFATKFIPDNLHSHTLKVKVEPADETEEAKVVPIQFPQWRSGTGPNAVKLTAEKQDAVVNVVLQDDPQTHQQLPVGFGGRNRPLFTVENKIEPGKWLLFTDHGSDHHHSYNCGVTVFHDWGMALYEDPKHCCPLSMPTHVHNDEAPHYFKQLSTYNVDSHLMSIPKALFRQHNIHMHNEAVLKFGLVNFPVKIVWAGQDGMHPRLRMRADWVPPSVMSVRLSYGELPGENILPSDGPPTPQAVTVST